MPAGGDPDDGRMGLMARALAPTFFPPTLPLGGMRASLIWKYRVDDGGRLASRGECVLLVGEREVRCISSGSTRWRYEGKVRNVEIAGSVVLILTNDLICLNIDNGEELWSRGDVDLMGVDGDRICVASANRVACLNLDGSVRWTYELPSRIKSISVSGDLVYLLCDDGFLYSLRETEDSPLSKPSGFFLPQQPETEELAFEGGWVPSELL